MSTRNCPAWVCGFTLLIAGMAAHATSRPAVVELFTSEGCSSCPPAEEYLGELTGRSDVLALSFHVDYWDDLGWRDPFSLAAFTTRQRGYASRLKLSSIFTPQVIVDGQESLLGSDRRAIGASLRSSREASVALALTQQNGDLVVAVTPAPNSEPADLIFVSFRRQVKSSIGRGENQGRTLQEFNVVRELRVIGHSAGSPLQLRVPVASMPKDATDIAVLAQRQGQGEILGAVRLALPAIPQS
jgi:hypothetical protein